MLMKKKQHSYRVTEQTENFIEDLIQTCSGLNKSTAIDLLVDIVSGNFVPDDITKHYNLIFKDSCIDGRRKL